MVDETGGGVRIGRLRWQVTFETRGQQPDPTPGGTGIVETPVLPKQIHADIQAIGDATFWGSAQTDGPITHQIYIRWQDYPDNTTAIIRCTLLPDNSTRRETFRVRKVSELGGRKRFVRVLAQLELTQ